MEPRDSSAGLFGTRAPGMAIEGKAVMYSLQKDTMPGCGVYVIPAQNTPRRRNLAHAVRTFMSARKKPLTAQSNRFAAEIVCQASPGTKATWSSSGADRTWTYAAQLQKGSHIYARNGDASCVEK